MRKNDGAILSIIVPVYNQHKYLRQCVDSLIHQTLKEIEIILVDDGSTDDSGQICEKYAACDSRIVVIHKENGGLSDARNKGIDIAEGRYLAFVDSDDYVSERMFELLVKAIEEQEADLAVCNCNLVDKDGNEIVEEGLQGKLPYAVCTGREVLQNSNENVDYWLFVVAWNKVYKRELFEKVRYPLGKLHEDEFVFHKIYSQCKRVASVEPSLYYYRRMQGTITDKQNIHIRMDRVEALYYRILFFLEQGMRDAAVKSEQFMYMDLWTVTWDRQTRKRKERMKECRRLFRRVNQIFYEKKIISLKQYWTRRFFCRFPFLYCQCIRIKSGIQRRLPVKSKKEAF